MKVTCPGCNSSYRVADEKVPASGAKIKCPKCQLTFIVQRQQSREKPAEPPAAPPQHEQLTPLDQLGSGPPNPVPSTSPAPVPAQAPSLVQAPAAGQARGVSAIRAQSGTALDSFKVRTASGLVYDFATRDAMRHWLAAREDAAQCQYAEPGGGWLPAQNLLATAPATQTLIALTPGQPIVPQPRVVIPLRPEASRAPGPLLLMGVIVVWLAALTGAAATITRYGIFDAGRFLPLDRFGVFYPGKNQPPAAQPVIEQDPERIYAGAMQSARQAMQKGRYSKAALEFNRALSVKAGSEEALEGYAQACEKLGDLDRARATREKINSLRQ
jgi:predicted Zn finger-like uncharacterized protein